MNPSSFRDQSEMNDYFKEHIKIPKTFVTEKTNTVAKGKYLDIVNQYYSLSEDSVCNREFLRVKKMCAAVLLYCEKENKYLLVRQFRYPVFYNEAHIHDSYDPHSDAFLYEIVAGVVDSKDSAEDTAIREAKEEANADVKKVKKLHTFFASPGCSNEEMTVYLGYVDSILEIEGKAGLSNENEATFFKWFSPEEIQNLVNRNLIRDSKTLIALYASHVL